MELRDLAGRFAALSHPTRVALIRLLVGAGPGGLPASEIAAAVGVAPSSLSFHLREMEGAGLIRPARQGRVIRYAAELDAVRGLAAFLAETCCDGRPELCGEGFAGTRGATPAATRPYTVLFLCTGNSHRSVMAEAILNREGAGRFRAFSAGSHPEGTVAPETLDLLRRLDYPIAGLRSKSWDEFARPGAPALDFVFTVCDAAAGEICPTWPGQPLTAHWGVPDPARAGGGAAERGIALSDTYRMLANRIGIFVNLPLRSLDRLALQQRLDEIGRLPRTPRLTPIAA
ncbi:metalloregulator ArsR/SmtB family transcription factor [Elioraea sp. Yellowstone]|jgi:arsenate reductase|uniref:metalloregulator ArsR/SmtB family transcription factor n=1 Tax=Elioraea sp. Yellowstone TaxID=2592070 RepID=UPI0011507A1C|nr:metalloregulator ArsR/SmtB family transcription factor [Elioraea sp. Yellowstone]TQF76619.1 metalloregulator ArsR/SmtB family transcription factor [Elioraea sp. Yellowstone]